MSELFDIFIKGIDPERISEEKEIKIQAAKVLQISLSELDELLAQPNGACIRRGSPEDEAKQYQRTLSKLGLVCIYAHAKRLTNLELIPLEEEILATSLICPSCEHEMPIEEDEPEPEKCEKCGISIAKFLEQQQQEKEREAIKAKLLASQTIIKNQTTKKQQEEAEKQRKLDLEKQVLQELHGSGEVEKTVNVKLLVISGGLILLTAGVSYLLSQSPKPPVKIATSTPALTTNSQEQSTTNSNIQLATPDAKMAAAKGVSQQGAPMTAQQAMQKTHDQAAKVLNGFGLNADAFANGGSSGGGQAMPLSTEDLLQASNDDSMLTGGNSTATATASNSTPVNATMTINSNATAVTNSNTAAQQGQIPTSVSRTGAQKSMNSQELFSALSNDITWDYFLAQNSKTLLERQLPEKAVKLIKYIVANDVYVDALGVLLNAARQGEKTKLVDEYLAALETRLAQLPAEQQAVYFAQAGGYLPLENGSNRLLVRAENLLKNLKSEIQLNAVLKLAVVYSKMGNIAKANDYFSQINTLLAPITDPDAQVQFRTAVAKAYQEVGNASVSMQWLESSTPLIKQLKLETLGTLVTGYANCNQWQGVLNVLTQIGAKEHYDLWLYQAIVTSLKSGFIPSALELNKSLQLPVYKSLSAIFIANYSTATAEGLLASSEAFLTGQATDAEKIIVASRLISYFGKIKNVEKITGLTTILENTLDKLPISSEKDELLSIVVQQYIHGFQSEEADHLLVGIESSELKTRLNLEIKQLTTVGKLMTDNR